MGAAGEPEGAEWKGPEKLGERKPIKDPEEGTERKAPEKLGEAKPEPDVKDPEEGAERKAPEKHGEPKPEPDIRDPEEGAERKAPEKHDEPKPEPDIKDPEEGAPAERKGAEKLGEPLCTDIKDAEEERKGLVIGGEEKPKPKQEAAIVDGTEPDERKVVEERLAARYEIPVEVFSAGSPSGCTLVFTLDRFLVATREDRASSTIYLMPYLPLDDAVTIAAEVRKKPSLRRLVVNPDVLASKVSAKHAIKAQVDEARALLLQAPEGPDAAGNKESRKEEDRQKMQRFSLGLDLVTFRQHMQRRLLLAYAAQGKWLMVHSFLAQLFPSSYSDASMPTDNLKMTIQIMKTPYAEVDDVRGVSSQLISIVAVEHWNEEMYKARGQTLSKLNDHFADMCKECSLIGASDMDSALIIMKKVFAEFISVGISKGGLAEDFVWSREAKVAWVELEKRGVELINNLIDQIYDVPINFEEMAGRMEQLMQIAIRCGAKRLKTKCQNFIECCQQMQDKEECMKLLSKVPSECCDVNVPLDNIFELQKLIQLVEGMIHT